MTALFALRIYGPCTLETLAERLGISDQAADLELWRLESHDQVMPWLDDIEVMWDLTPLGVDEFKAQAKRAKDAARLCQGVGR